MEAGDDISQWMLTGCVRLLTALALVMALASPAHAHFPLCDTVEAIHIVLERAGEEVKAIGVLDGGGLAQLWIGPTSWSVVVVVVKGSRRRACLVATGSEWADLQPGTPA